MKEPDNILLVGKAYENDISSYISTRCTIREVGYELGTSKNSLFAKVEERNTGSKVEFPDHSIKIAKGAGRYDNALLFTNYAFFRPFFRGEGNVGYNNTEFSLTDMDQVKSYYKIKINSLTGFYQLEI